MKIALSIVLLALVASMIVAPAFADSKIDSFVNLATQARTQVKMQLDKMPSASDEIKSMFAQGDQETEQLVVAVKKGDEIEAKKHFLAAMKLFRQITQVFSEPTQVDTAIASSKIAAAPEFDYANALKRFESNINILKSVAAKNNLQVDFGKIDNLLQVTKSNLVSGDVAALEKTFGELKAAGVELQSTIKNMVTERSNTRAITFANKYVTKIDAILAQANELGLSEEDVTKLKKAREDLTSGGDANQIIIKIRKVYQINLDAIESKNQNVAAKSQVTQSETQDEAKTDELKVENAPKPKISDSKQERLKQKDAKNQKFASEISRIEAKLAELEPHIDENIKPKFESAKSLLAKLKESGENKKTQRMIDSLLAEMIDYLDSQNTHE